MLHDIVEAYQLWAKQSFRFASRHGCLCQGADVKHAVFLEVQTALDGSIAPKKMSQFILCALKIACPMSLMFWGRRVSGKRSAAEYGRMLRSEQWWTLAQIVAFLGTYSSTSCFWCQKPGSSCTCLWSWTSMAAPWTMFWNQWCFFLLYIAKPVFTVYMWSHGTKHASLAYLLETLETHEPYSVDQVFCEIFGAKACAIFSPCSFKTRSTSARCISVAAWWKQSISCVG